MLNKPIVVAYCDGFLKSKQHKEPGCSVAIYVRGKLTHKKKYFIGKEKNYFVSSVLLGDDPTSNIMEYYAVYKSLKSFSIFSERYNNAIEICSDSQLIVKQLNGDWVINNNKLHLFHRYIGEKFAYINLQMLWLSRKKMVELFGH